jgi:hypothetical protein
MAAPVKKTENALEEVVVDERDLEIERLRAELKDLSVVRAPEVEPGPQPSAEMPTLRLQSKYRNHTIQLKATRRIFHVGGGIEPVAGVAVRFEGPQRLFDSAAAQRTNGWSNELRDEIERKLVTRIEYMNDYYPAPLSPLPEHLAAIARIKAPVITLKCQQLGYDGQGGLIQCMEPVTAGRKFCQLHDPDETRIIRGGGTTAS